MGKWREFLSARKFMRRWLARAAHGLERVTTGRALRTWAAAHLSTLNTRPSNGDHNFNAQHSWAIEFDRTGSSVAGIPTLNSFASIASSDDGRSGFDDTPNARAHLRLPNHSSWDQRPASQPLSPSRATDKPHFLSQTGTLDDSEADDDIH